MGKRENLRELGGRPGPSDPKLLDRLVEYGRKHQLNDMDAALEYLRRHYPEYRRKQAVPFRKYLALQVPEVRRRIEARKEKEDKEKEKEKEPELRNTPRSRAEEEEDRLREREAAHEMEIHGVGDMNEDMAFDVESPDATDDEGERDEAAVVVTGSSNKIEDEEESERPAFAPPHVIAEVLRAATARPLKSPQPERATIEERGSPVAQTSGRPVQLVKTFSSQFQGSVVQQENGRPYLPLVSSTKNDKIKQSDDRESAPVAQESKLIRKREREIEKARAGSKKGKYGHEKGDNKEALDDVKGASSAAAVPRNVSFKDFGGIEGVLGMIRDLIEYPLVHPNVYDHLGVQPPRGVLLHGPPGCGKTMLANAIAVETGVPFLKISAPEVVSGMSGASRAL